jgi:putative Mg2+ transporter-C (MgtC) family protein
MPLTIHASDIALRLALTAVAGGLLGINRAEHGHAAGLRTTLLVALAAAVSMIQVNLLIVTDGKTATSFSVLDLMRLPLGILTGMGFIGAGAIVRRGGEVSGVTTAAVLWLVTVLGLCFGGGQLALGCVVTVLALVAITVLKRVEHRLKEVRTGRLTLKMDERGPRESDLRSLLAAGGYRVVRCNVSYLPRQEGRMQRWDYEVRWRSRTPPTEVPSLVGDLARRDGVFKAVWKT